MYCLWDCLDQQLLSLKSDIVQYGVTGVSVLVHASTHIDLGVTFDVA